MNNLPSPIAAIMLLVAASGAAWALQPSTDRPAQRDQPDSAARTDANRNPNDTERAEAEEIPRDVLKFLQRYEGTWRVEITDGEQRQGDTDRSTQSGPSPGSTTSTAGAIDRQPTGANPGASGNNNSANPAPTDRGEAVNPDRRPVGEAQSDRAPTAPSQREAALFAGDSSTSAVRSELRHGTHLFTQTSGSFRGTYYEGEGILTFDPATKRFESIWCDSAAPGLSYMVGRLDADKRVLTLTSPAPGASGKTSRSKRSVTRWITDDQYVIEVFAGESGASGGGSERREMVLTFTRSDADGRTAGDDARKQRDRLDYPAANTSPPPR